MLDLILNDIDSLKKHKDIFILNDFSFIDDSIYFTADRNSQINASVDNQLIEFDAMKIITTGDLSAVAIPVRIEKTYSNLSDELIEITREFILSESRDSDDYYRTINDFIYFSSDFKDRFNIMIVSINDIVKSNVKRYGLDSCWLINGLFDSNVEIHLHYLDNIRLESEVSVDPGEYDTLDTEVHSVFVNSTEGMTLSVLKSSKRSQFKRDISLLQDIISGDGQPLDLIKDSIIRSILKS